MADWFRWWHGTVTDAKFGVISTKVGCSLPEVITVWVYLLEHASQCHIRGDVSRFVTENVTRHETVTARHDGVTELSWASRIRHETVTAIVTEMCDAGMIIDGRIEAWERRQPVREDAVTTGAKTAAQRAKEYRDRKKLITEKRHAHVTQRHADETPQSRVEQSRTEVNTPSISVSTTEPESREKQPSSTRKGLVCGLLRKAGMADAAPHYLTDEDWEAILSKRTDEEIVELAVAKMQARPGKRTGLKYIAPALLEDPQKLEPKPKREAQWWSTEETIQAKGRELGLTPRPGESWPEFKLRINEKLAEQQQEVAA